MGLLADTQNCGLRMRRECRERFPHHRLQRKLLVSGPGMHHGTCDARAVMHVGIANPRWRGKRSRHSRRMRNPQFCVSGKRPIGKPQEGVLDRLILCRLFNGSQLVVRIFTTESLPRHLFTVNRPLGEANTWISE